MVYVNIPEVDDHISNTWKKGMFYEAHQGGMLPRVHELRKRYENKLALDIGAHWGNHSIFFAEVLDMKVVAFEPCAESYDRLVKNTRSMNVECRKAVMGDTDFDRYTQIDGPAGNTGMTSFKKKRYDANTLPENRGTAGTSLDFIYPVLAKSYTQKLRLIKIDVEGSEMEVVRGALKTIKKHNPDLWIETNKASTILELLNENRAEKRLYKMEGPYNHTPTWRFYV